MENQPENLQGVGIVASRIRQADDDPDVSSSMLVQVELTPFSAILSPYPDSDGLGEVAKPVRLSLPPGRLSPRH